MKSTAKVSNLRLKIFERTLIDMKGDHNVSSNNDMHMRGAWTIKHLDNV